MKKLTSLVVLVLLVVSCGQRAKPVPSPTALPSKTVVVKPTPKPKPSKTIEVFPTGKTPANITRVLVLGSDTRSCSKSNPQGNIGGTRADAIHLVSINRATYRASTLNFPRDSWVSIPGHGKSKINAALAWGGPKLMVRTVEQLTDMDVHYYAITSFCGFIDLINSLGGVRMNIPKTIQDSYADYHYRDCERVKRVKSGNQLLDGCEAIFVARSRHASATGSDFARTTNQGKLLLAMLSRFREIARTPSGMLKLLNAAKKFVRFNMPWSEALGLANLARKVSPSKVQNITLPGSGGRAGSQSVVFLSSRAYSIFRDVRSDAVVG